MAQDQCEFQPLFVKEETVWTFLFIIEGKWELLQVKN